MDIETKFRNASPFVQKWSKRIFIFAIIFIVYKTLIWVVPDAAPAKITYCRHATSDGPTCSLYKVLRIPRTYLHNYGGIFDKFPRTVTPYASSYFRLELAYPSMQPWNNLSKQEQLKQHWMPLNLDYWGEGEQNIDPKFQFGPTGFTDLNETVYGLRKFKWLGEFELLSTADVPAVHLRCYQEFEPGISLKKYCRVSARASWPLHISYAYPQFFVPNWQDVHAAVLKKIDSFVVDEPPDIE